MLDFTCTAAERRTARKIVARTMKLLGKVDKEVSVGLQMDLEACHSNGCPLDFDKLLAADDFNLMHDIMGINNNLNRETGELRHCFLPRCAVPANATA